MKDLWISKAIYGREEITAVERVLNSGWLGIGKKSLEFERQMASFIKVKHAMFVNSGSSALLLGLLSLDIPKGSEIITCAAGFPSTLNPILHAGYKPVLVDCELDTLNINPDLVVAAMTEKTGAVIFAHAAGNPVDMERMDYALKSVPSIEDACDSLGAEYRGKKVGSFGTVSAFSFYASHHITAAGGGGMALTDNSDLATKMFSMRDWGKRYDAPGYYQRNNSVYDTLIDGVFYDRSYSYDTIGFNMKMNEISAAFGVEQMKKLPTFIQKRRDNFNYLYDNLKKNAYFVPPRFYKGASPFFYVFIIKDDAPFTRKEFADYLEDQGINTRPFFAGNILRQPALKQAGIKVYGTLTNANKLMEDAVMIGCHPGMTERDINYIIEEVDIFTREYDE